MALTATLEAGGVQPDDATSTRAANLELVHGRSETAVWSLRFVCLRCLLNEGVEGLKSKIL
jgi:hypothetical protein